MAIEFERNGKRWVLTAERVDDNADNRDADAEDLALGGSVIAEEHRQLIAALRWLPVGVTVNFCDVDGFLEEVREMGWKDLRLVSR